jgi:L-arabinose isomerase
MALASGALGAAGSIYGGMQANAQGKYESALAKRNAALEIEGYREDRDAAYGERRDFWRKVGAIKGQQIAAMAANGIDVNFGSAARLQEDTQMLANEDAENLYRNQKEKFRGRLINAANYTAEAKAARRRGKAELVSSIFQGASSLLGGASQFASLKAKMGGSTA